MIDIKNFFSYVLGRNQNSPDGTPPQGYAPNEDFESKRTTKVGMIFVIIMVVTGVWQGQILFEAINSSITPSQNLSYCYQQLVFESDQRIDISYDSSSRYSQYSYQNMQYDGDHKNNQSTCMYTDIENKYLISALYAEVEPLFSKRDSLQKEKSDLEQKLYSVRYSSNSVRDAYNTSLFESITQSGDTVYSSSSLGVTLRTKEEQIRDLESQITEKSNSISDVISTIKGQLTAKFSSLQNVANDFNSRVKWLEFKRFLISIILLAPLAFFALRKYFRSKNERSEYAIIWAGVALISTILSSQLLVVFVYKILPHQLLATIAEFFASMFKTFTFLFVVLEWLGLILVPLFFGFLVSKIQKRYYNKEAVMMRALKEGKCPQCAMKIKDGMVFCPSCSYTLRKPCTKCQHTSISYARFCEECGTSFILN